MGITKRNEPSPVKGSHRAGKYGDLKLPKGGKLVYACIGDFKGRGRQRLILHEVRDPVQFSYGDGQVWHFPTGKGRRPKKKKR